MITNIIDIDIDEMTGRTNVAPMPAESTCLGSGFAG